MGAVGGLGCSGVSREALASPRAGCRRRRRQRSAALAQPAAGPLAMKPGTDRGVAHCALAAAGASILPHARNCRLLRTARRFGAVGSALWATVG